MDFIDKIAALSASIPKKIEFIQTEEATKNALVLPFIAALGYDVSDPTEVIPEFTADVGTKKGEKVDYAIFKDGKPIILIECKCQDCDLDKEHASQLFRYFTVTEAKFAILTNGMVYRFFTDLDEKNRMDAKPFFEFNLLEIKEQLVEELKKFTKTAYDTDQILATASELKYTREIKRMMAEQIANPSDDFVRLFASHVYPGRMTQPVKQQFAEITKRALHLFISDRISERLKSALQEEAAPDHKAGGEAESKVDKPADAPTDTRIVTTPEEVEAYYVIKSILREVVDVKRVFRRDGVACCSILLDNTNRKPICRLWFSSSEKCLSLLDENKEEQRYSINDLNDLYNYSEQLRAALSLYSGKQ